MAGLAGWDGRGEDRPNLLLITMDTTLAECFSSKGYRTAAFVAAFVLDHRFGLNRGFDIYDDYKVPTSRETWPTGPLS